MNFISFQDWLADQARPPLVMGILNVTPDSFSDGGQYLDPAAAVERAQRLVAEGAELLDVGAESTRPGAAPVPADEQIRRLTPVLTRLASLDTTISVDTTDSTVAEAALDAGAHWINDVSAGRGDPRMLPLAAKRSVPVCLMHMHGEPRSMQRSPTYDDVVAEVRSFLAERRDAALAAGIRADRVVLDVGIGFGKTQMHNLTLLRRHAEFQSLGAPMMLGTSRKKFIGEITGADRPEERVFGTAATVAWGLANGADILRVHDVAPIVQVVRMIRAIKAAE